MPIFRNKIILILLLLAVLLAISFPQTADAFFHKKFFKFLKKLLPIIIIVAAAVVGGMVVSGLILVKAAGITSLLIVGSAVAVTSVIGLDCVLPNVGTDPNFVCKGTTSIQSFLGGGGIAGCDPLAGATLTVDVKAKDSDGPLNLIEPAFYNVAWCISGVKTGSVQTEEGTGRQMIVTDTESGSEPVLTDCQWGGNRFSGRVQEFSGFNQELGDYIDKGGGKREYQGMKTGTYTYTVTCTQPKTETVTEDVDGSIREKKYVVGTESTSDTVVVTVKKPDGGNGGDGGGNGSGGGGGGGGGGSCTADTWSCGDWSSCLNGNQTRSCSKTFDCPSVDTQSPPTSQRCSQPSSETKIEPKPGTQCNPPSWEGKKVDACWDERGRANCDRKQDVANQWCQQSCGGGEAIIFSTEWIEGVGTKYIPTERVCENCSLTLSSITCGTRRPPPAAIMSFIATPKSINPGESTTLSWSSINATSCNIDQGIGALSFSGSRSVNPTKSTTYTLICSGEGGSHSSSVTVDVSKIPFQKEIVPE